MICATDIVRFWKQVDSVGNVCECWFYMGSTWGGSRNGKKGGWGRFWLDGKTVQAHRFAYETTIGRIPDGMQIDHLCRNRDCVNPFHLEPVTSSENNLRSESPSSVNARKMKCKYGHEELAFRSGGIRYCLKCHRDRERKRREAV